MKHIVQIDDNTPTGKSLIELLQQMASKFKSVSFLSNTEREELEDLYFGKMIEEADRGEYVSEEEIMKALES